LRFFRFLLYQRGARGFFIKKGELGGRKNGKGVRKALTFLMGHFDPLFLSPPHSGSGKGRSDFEAISGDINLLQAVLLLRYFSFFFFSYDI